MKFYFESYRAGSRSVNRLKTELRAFGHIVHSEHQALLGNGWGSLENAKRGYLVIRWGSSRGYSFQSVSNLTSRGNILINNDVSWLSNKREFFRTMFATGSVLGDSCVPWTLDKNQAEIWLTQGKTVVARTILSGHSGNGIVMVAPGGQLPEAPLYTQYVKKKYEYRVHIFRGLPNRTIWQQKKAIRGFGEIDYRVRNHHNGWVFAREDLSIPSSVADSLEVWRNAFFEKTRVDFAAIDVIYNQGEDRAYVLEANSAPGLEGTTVTDYANAFTDMWVNSRNGTFIPGET